MEGGREGGRRENNSRLSVSRPQPATVRQPRRGSEVTEAFLLSGRRRVGGGQAAHLQAPRVKLAACFEEPDVSHWMRLDAVWFPSDVEKQPQRAQQQTVFSGVSSVNSSCELFSRCSVFYFFLFIYFFSSNRLVINS